MRRDCVYEAMDLASRAKRDFLQHAKLFQQAHGFLPKNMGSELSLLCLMAGEDSLEEVLDYVHALRHMIRSLLSYAPYEELDRHLFGMCQVIETCLEDVPDVDYPVEQIVDLDAVNLGKMRDTLIHVGSQAPMLRDDIRKVLATLLHDS